MERSVRRARCYRIGPIHKTQRPKGSESASSITTAEKAYLRDEEGYWGICKLCSVGGQPDLRDFVRVANDKSHPVFIVSYITSFSAIITTDHYKPASCVLEPCTTRCRFAMVRTASRPGACSLGLSLSLQKRLGTVAFRSLLL